MTEGIMECMGIRFWEIWRYKKVLRNIHYSEGLRFMDLDKSYFSNEKNQTMFGIFKSFYDENIKEFDYDFVDQYIEKKFFFEHNKYIFLRLYIKYNN